MTTQPLDGAGPFQIGEGITVRLRTAEQKGLAVAISRRDLKLLHQIVTQDLVTLSFHASPPGSELEGPFGPSGIRIARMSREKVNNL